MASESERQILNLNFRAEFEGLAELGYCSISGLESAVEVIDKQGTNRREQKIKPGSLRHENIILRRGLTENRALWDWYQSSRKGKPQPKDGVITILDEEKRPFLSIIIRQAWPCRWQLSKLDANQGEVLIEEIELVIDAFRLK